MHMNLSVFFFFFFFLGTAMQLKLNLSCNFFHFFKSCISAAVHREMLGALCV